MTSAVDRNGRFGPKVLFALVALFLIYSAYLYMLTVFKGFTTLSSDSFGYILLARKWSPWFTPSVAETLTWPGQQYPPVFSWLLAITGASESYYFAHMLVWLFILVALVLIGLMAYREVGRNFGLPGAVAVCLVPGVVYSSMGILSENLYLALTLGSLLLYSSIAKKAASRPGAYILLWLLLSLVLLTRTIGIALVVSLTAAALFDRTATREKRIAYLFVSLGAIVVWQLWGVMDPQSHELGYLKFLSLGLGSADMGAVRQLTHLLSSVRTNVVAILGSWNHYLTIGQAHLYFFLLSYLLLILSLVSTALRAIQLKPDAVYILLYLAILLIWPYPDEMLRFLHPIVLLMLLQPVLLVGSVKPQLEPKARVVVFSLSILTGLTFLLGQWQILERMNFARANNLPIAHFREYYSIPNFEEAIRKARIYHEVLYSMKSSASVVPEGSTVASVQYAAYTLQADRTAVNLSVIVPYPQQLCNFKVADVDFVFISGLTGAYNPLAMKLYEHYMNLAVRTWSISNDQGVPAAHLLELDKEKIDQLIKESGFDCRAFVDRPMPAKL